MKELQKKLIDAYAYDMNVASSSFEFMGRLLDIEYVKKRIELFGLSEIFVYGGGYLGIQFYNSVHEFVNIQAIIDRRQKIQIDSYAIPVVDIGRLREIYNGQTVIIASVRFYHDIRNELLGFVSEEKIMSLGEFLGGMSQ